MALLGFIGGAVCGLVGVMSFADGDWPLGLLAVGVACVALVAATAYDRTTRLLK